MLEVTLKLIVNITKGAGDTQGRATGVSQCFTLGVEPAIRAVLHGQTILDPVRRVTRAIVEVLGKCVKRGLFVLWMKPVCPTGQHVGKVSLVIEAQKRTQLLGPPESIVRVDRITRNHLHVPEAFTGSAVDQIKPRFVSSRRRRSLAEKMAGGFKLLLKLGNPLFVQMALAA
ncbi:hypothetical protein ALP75_205602 [Pseudomonas syringae pv. actinidiae]|nr:hypothetical protein ALP75_205602 [Pseudomonas syringae pv. actinidiae]